MADWSTDVKGANRTPKNVLFCDRTSSATDGVVIAIGQDTNQLICHHLLHITGTYETDAAASATAAAAFTSR